MQGMRTAITIILCCLPAGWALAKEAPFNERLQALEQEIVHHLQQLKDAPIESVRYLYHDSLRMAFAEALSIEGSFDYPFDRIKTMSVLTSDDGLFRLFNWNLPNDDGTHFYGCFFQWKSTRKKDAEVNWVELTIDPDDRPLSANKYMTPEKWKGALYYDVITVNHKKNHYYLLLGWDGADALINRKVIEPITFSGGKVRLGAPVFKVDRGSPKRHVLEYSEEVMVSLKYHKGEKRIVFDHLAPRAAGLEGNPAFYGPDLTFDAFVYDNGKWVLESNVNVTLSREQSQRPYIDPRLRP